MRILVTGGLGFIGRHLCERLRSEGHEIDIFDNRISSPKDLKNPTGCTVLEIDVEGCCEREVSGYDRIYHLACPASPVHYQKDPVKTISTCFNGTRNVLHFSNGARVLIASTSEIYGDPEESPQHERYRGSVNTMGPRACYDEGKRAAESLAWIYNEHHGVDIRVPRIFNTYGPGMAFDDGRVVSNFIMQILDKRDLTIYGSGKQTRSFCYVRDTVDALIRLMEYEGVHRHEPFNIGNPSEITIHDIACMVFDLAGGVTSRYKMRPLPLDDPKTRKPDIHRARTLLGWEPQVSLVKGLQMTIKDFRERREMAFESAK